MKSPSTVLRSLARELIQFVFPSYCIHCQGVDLQASQLFCFSCKELIERVPLHECGPYKAAAVIKEGVALSLLKEARGGLFEEAISTMAALMLIQMIDLAWPLPSKVTSSEDPLDQALAKKLAELLDIPYKKRKHLEICSSEILLTASLEGDPSQETLEELAPRGIYQMSFC